METYLCTQWLTKDFSLRDLIDRVAVTSLANDKFFLVLFTWLMSVRLSASEESWSIEDFRKLALNLAKSLKTETVSEFFKQAVDKCGRAKVRDFMEIQLMHNQNEYNIFIQWFNNNFEDPAQPHVKMPQLKINQIDDHKFEDQELRDALSTNNQ